MYNVQCTYVRVDVVSLNLVLRQPQERAEGRLVGFLMLLAQVRVCSQLTEMQ